MTAPPVHPSLLHMVPRVQLAPSSQATELEQVPATVQKPESPAHATQPSCILTGLQSRLFLVGEQTVQPSGPVVPELTHVSSIKHQPVLGVPPPQTSFVQVVFSRHETGLSHAPLWEGCTHSPSSHSSSVQGLESVQSRGTPSQMPSVHLSASVHGSPSSQRPVLEGAWLQSPSSPQVSKVQGSPSSQAIAALSSGLHSATGTTGRQTMGLVSSSRF